MGRDDGVFAEIKKLIRFDPKTAIEKCKKEASFLSKKYSDSTSYANVEIEQLRTDTDLLKECVKALMYDYDKVFLLNEIDPILDQLYACSSLCKCVKTETSEALQRAQVQAPLLYSKGIILQVSKP